MIPRSATSVTTSPSWTSVPVLRVVLVLAALGPSAAFAQEAKEPREPKPKQEITTPVGTFAIKNVRFADEFPIGCKPAAYPGAPGGNCNQPRPGYRFLVVHITHPDALGNASFTDPISSDIRKAVAVPNEGKDWVLAMWTWQIGRGVFLVFGGRGTPETFLLRWPGNDAIALTPAEG